VGPRVLRRDRVAKSLGAPSDRVLIDVVRDGLPRGVFQDLWSGQIREALREVHGIVLQREPGHLPNHAFGDAARAVGAEGFLGGLHVSIIRQHKARVALRARTITAGAHYSVVADPQLSIAIGGPLLFNLARNGPVIALINAEFSAMEAR